jgi:dissimilatory sulfite reductase (desulfoviridin) alpha/beta subunit
MAREAYVVEAREKPGYWTVHIDREMGGTWRLSYYRSTCYFAQVLETNRVKLFNHIIKNYNGELINIDNASKEIVFKSKEDAEKAKDYVESVLVSLTLKYSST